MIVHVTLTEPQAKRLADFVRILDRAQMVPERGHDVALIVARQVAAQLTGNLPTANAAQTRPPVTPAKIDTLPAPTGGGCGNARHGVLW